VDLLLTEIQRGVKGRIVDVDGLPLARTGVRVFQWLPSGLEGAAPWSFAYSIDGMTESEGTFELRGLLGARSALEVYPPHKARGVAPLPIPIDARTEGVTSLGAIALPLGGGIQGTLRVSADQEATSGQIAIRVLPVLTEGNPATARLLRTEVARRDGATFRFVDLAPGTYRLIGPGRLTELFSAPLAEVRVEPGRATTVEVVWKP